jgi:hypothetical protein
MSVSHPDVIPFPGRPATPAEPTESIVQPILVVTSDSSLSSRLAADLQALGLPCRTVNTVETAVQSLQQSLSEVCLIGPLPPGNTCGQLAGQINQRG